MSFPDKICFTNRSQSILKNRIVSNILNETEA